MRMKHTVPSIGPNFQLQLLHGKIISANYRNNYWLVYRTGKLINQFSVFQSMNVKVFLLLFYTTVSLLHYFLLSPIFALSYIVI